MFGYRRRGIIAFLRSWAATRVAMVVAVLLTVLLTVGCDRLEADDATGSNLVGRWSFSYKSTEPLGVELAYRYLLFRADGSCAIVFSDGQQEGTFRASRDVIRIVTVTDDGKEHVLLWRVLQMSPYRVMAEYGHQLSDDSVVTLTVTLDRL